METLHIFSVNFNNYIYCIQISWDILNVGILKHHCVMCSLSYTVTDKCFQQNQITFINIHTPSQLPVKTTSNIEMLEARASQNYLFYMWIINSLLLLSYITEQYFKWGGMMMIKLLSWLTGSRVNPPRNSSHSMTKCRLGQLGPLTLCIFSMNGSSVYVPWAVIIFSSLAHLMIDYSTIGLNQLLDNFAAFQCRWWNIWFEFLFLPFESALAYAHTQQNYHCSKMKVMCGQWPWLVVFLWGSTTHASLSMFGLRPFIEVKVQTKTGWELALPPWGNASYRSHNKIRKGNLRFIWCQFLFYTDMAAPL